MNKWLSKCVNCGWSPPPEKILTEIIPDASYYCKYKIEHKEVAKLTQAQKVEEVNNPDARTILHPVPTRPTGGRGKGNANWLIARYYDENKAAILKDLAELGRPGMLKRWGINSSTWGRQKGLAYRWGVEIKRTERYGKPLKRRAGKAPAAVQAAAPAAPVVKEGGANSEDKSLEQSVRGQVEAELKKRLTEITLPGKGEDSKQPSRPALRQDSEQAPSGVRVTIIPLSQGLPPLPEFESGWADAVKLKWLEVYEKLGASQK